MDRDRNLLFGVLAVQLKQVTPTDLVDVAAAWATDPSRDLASRLVDRDILSEDDRRFINDVVDRAVQAHGGDAQATLASFGGDEQVYQSFGGSIVLTESGDVKSIAAPVSGTEVIDPESVPAVQESPGRYTHVSEYGRGGMGRVLLVQDQHLGRDIALKELLPGLGSSGDEDSDKPSPVRLSMPVVARFLQEARITGQLEHPSIVPVYELGHRKDGTLYYTMKLVRGQTLSKAIKDAETLPERLRLLPHFVDLCQAIAYAHSRAIIHRDIKPTNVMVGEFGETVVLDWGLAKARDRKDVHADGLAETLHAMNLGDEGGLAKTQYGQALGTPVYMPPEQALGQLTDVDETSDVYSLGAVLYEFLTGRAPFDGRNAREVLDKVIKEEPEPIAARVPDAPPELVAICNRALAKSKATRYPSARDLAEEVQRFQSGALVQAYRYSTGEHLKRFVLRHKTILGVAAAALFVLIGVLAVSYVQVMRERNVAVLERDRASTARDEAENQQAIADEQRRRAEKQSEIAESRRQEAEQQVYVSGVRLARLLFQNGQRDLAMRRLWLASETHRNWEWGYYLTQIDCTLVRANVPTGLRPDDVAISPDGTRIVSREDHKVRATSDGTEIATLDTKEETGSWSIQFVPDGTRIIAERGTPRERGVREIWVWDATSGEVLTVLEHESPVRKAGVSRDGARVVTASEDHLARVWDTSSGEVLLTLEGHGDMVLCATFSPDDARVATASEDGTARIWDAKNGQAIAVLNHDGPVEYVTYSFDGTRIATASEDGTARIWNVKTGEEQLVLRAHGDNEPQFAVFSPDGSRILTTWGQNIAHLWDAHNGEELACIDGPGSLGFLEDVAFSPDSAQLMMICFRMTADDERGTARFWDATTGEESLALSDRIAAHYTKDGTRIVIASQFSGIEIWRRSIDAGPIVLDSPGEDVECVAFSPDGGRVATAANDMKARVWDIRNGAEVLTVSHNKEAGELRFSPDGKRIITRPNAREVSVLDSWTGEVAASLSVDGIVRAWDRNSGNHESSPSRQIGSFKSTAFTPDGVRAVVAVGASLRIVDVETGAELATLSGSISGIINSCELSADGTRVLATSWEDHTVRIWDALNGEEGHLVTREGMRCPSAFFRANGRKVLIRAGQSEVDEVSIFDVESGEELLFLPSQKSTALSADGKRVLSTTADYVTRVLDAETGDELLALMGGGTRSAVFSPDGTRIVTTTWDDRTVRVWDAESGEEVATMTVPDSVVESAVFSPDGKTIVTSSDDNKIRLWTAHPFREEHLPPSEKPDGSWDERYGSWKKQQYQNWLVDRELE